ncbi:hypothetical protein [Hydrogenobacter hydrogenophilus]|uniref:Uncharacterized protein n=1 Tax=Hydrogenobacter hydrogenophilus TaxID=35835 RepID=A0A285P1L6_9AQUI|nr:hypothetical protein [Hydrogenobacter hydrogenophilus]SNZ15632.1 hypothetical protein SAMN06265353_1419 [Hydrogenobacter hydrogenophilus]
MSKLVDCVIKEIADFIEENKEGFIEIKNVKGRNGKPKKTI